MHTKGKLTTQGVHIFDEDNRQVCTVIGDFSDYEKSKNTSRRLVACWNACDGIDTTSLEGKGCLAHLINDISQQVDNARQERDELVSALREMRTAWNQSRSFNAMNVMFAQVDSILAKYPEVPNA